MKVLIVAGARPNFMKVAPIIQEMNKYPQEINYILVHTGQHYDREMSEIFFEDLNIPRPHIYLGVGSGSHAEQTAKIMMAFERVILQEQPGVVVLVGDVNSTLACAVVAAKINYPISNPNDAKLSPRKPFIAHVEAGLRSFDRTMPEEINRIVTDSLSDFLFTTSRDANENLINEGIPREKIFFVGNVMIDTLLKYLEIAKKSPILEKLGLGTTSGVNSEWKINRNYAVLTLHRPSNVDNYTTFSRIVEALTEVGRQMPIIFPIHPRTYNQIKAYGFERYFKFISVNNSYLVGSGINCIDSLGYLDFLQLVTHSKLVLTDSGGLQEETTVLGIPCLTIRENTERPVTISQGTNVLVGTDKNKIVFEATNAINGHKRGRKIPELWDGKAAQRIVEILLERQQGFPNR